MTADALIADIIRREGGFVDDPDDAGGATKYGITKATLSRWRQRRVTTAEVAALTVEEATDIYRAQYIDQPGFASLPEPLRAQVVDFGVNAGPAQATRLLQRAVGVREDGMLGPVTRAALAARDLDAVHLDVWRQRVRFYAHLVAQRPTQVKFLDGWLNRCWEMQPGA
jgi:lysozyme family protein